MDQKIWAKLALVFSALILPFWVTAALFLVCVFIFDDFYFGLAVMLFIELVYGFSSLDVFQVPGAIFVVSVIAFFLIMGLKKVIAIRSLV